MRKQIRPTLLLAGAVALVGTSVFSPGTAMANDGVTAPATNYSSAATPNTPIGSTPPMGFNNWARSQCTPQAPLNGTAQSSYSFQQYLEDNAKGLSDSGLIAAGYKTVTVDDCWMYRDSAGNLQGALNWGSDTGVRNTSEQPGFDASLASYGDYLHSLGAKFGIYETSGTQTCSTDAPTAPNLPDGSEYYEQNDANTFVSWGVDELKYDNCGDVEPTQTLDARMSADLATAVTKAAASGPTPNVLFDSSAPAGYEPSSTLFSDLDNERGLGQVWRIGPDISLYSAGSDPWDQPLASGGYNWGAYQSFNYGLSLSRYQSPGNFNDLDSLLIGDNGMTPAEERSQMALWSIMSAPLVISTDARKFEPSYIAANPSQAASLDAAIAALDNPQVVAVDQDPMGAGAYRVFGGGSNSDGTPNATSGVDVIAKPLASGARAVVVLNKGAATTDYDLSLSSLGFSNSGCTYNVDNLWNNTTSTSTGSVPLTIAPHDNAMLEISAQSGCGTFAPAGQITATPASWSNAALCLDNYESGTGTNNPVDTYPCTSGSNQEWQMDSNGSVQLQQSGASDLCLTAQSTTSASTIDGDTGQWVGVASCGSAPGYQTWTYDRDGNLKLSGTDSCLDVYGGSTDTPGNPVDLYPCGASPNSLQVNQTWAAPFSAPPAA